MIHSSFNLSDHNARIFFSAPLADWYASQGLCPAETSILLRHQPAFAGKRVLDIGVGSGRTTRFLLPLASHYTGIDVSPQMLAVCGKNFPAARLVSLDMRELWTFGEDAFDFVFAAYNVLGAVSHEERLKILCDTHRLLPPDGVFVVSSHNRNARWAGQPPALVRSRNPVRQALEVRRYLVATRNYRRMRAHVRIEQEYALFNDMAHHWSGVFYYIDRAAQIAQLEQAGFRVLDVVAENGRSLAPTDDDSGEGCLHFVCARSA